MNVEQFWETLEKYAGAARLKDFENLAVKYSSRRDLHAFMLLDSLLPNSKHDMVCAAEHDIIYLSVDVSELCQVITDEQIRELALCGCIREDDHLAMFV